MVRVGIRVGGRVTRVRVGVRVRVIRVRVRDGLLELG
jgi:hypothetical protein